MKANAFSIFFDERSPRRSQIHAVEFHQLRVVLDDAAGDLVAQAFGQGAAEIIARFLDAFVARKFFGHDSWSHVIARAVGWAKRSLPTVAPRVGTGACRALCPPYGCASMTVA
jgi:hypothetical protein